VDPALECTAPTVSGLDLTEFSVGGGRSVDWSESVYREWYTGVRWEKLKERGNLVEELGIVARTILQDRLCMYTATLWRVRIAIVPLYTQQCVVCVVELRVTVSCIQISSVAPQCFCG
jgi:hypothetical protein